MKCIMSIETHKEHKSEHLKEVTEMEEKERREETAVHLAAELKKAMESMDEARAERAIGILIGLSANKELLEDMKKDSA
jgi:DNA integrity scanning protein DisA with diadenylate cyclase activity